MSRIFISGSSTGLGLMAGKLLVEQGHQVTLHARNQARASDARRQLPQADDIMIGDLSTIAGAKSVADQVNAGGTFDAIIHNAAVGHQKVNELTEDGLPTIFAVNTLAPYILTTMIAKPRRQIYLSSNMHMQVDLNIDDILWKKRTWDGWAAYSESKFHDVMLAFAFARLWPDVYSNTLSPGWVPTRMGGDAATDDLDQGHRTQVWLAASEDPKAKTTGGYFFHLKQIAPHAQTRNTALQDKLLAFCQELSGVGLS